MTKVLIIGGGGMIGQKIAKTLIADGLNGLVPEKVILCDVAFPESGVSSVLQIQGGYTEPANLERIIAEEPEVIIHLAAIVSGAAERDFSLGWDINMHQMWTLLDAIRVAHEQTGYRPRFVFASSVAVFGGDLPDVIPDVFPTTPQSSYGAQKVVGEVLVNDFSRKGYIDGVSLRLPTISVRPGKPNLAASSCFSGIIREPLNGAEAILPVDPKTVHIHASPRSAAQFFSHAATMDTASLGAMRALNMPCVSCSIEEQIEALRSVAGTEVVGLIRHVPDPAIAALVKTWPRGFAAERAQSLGFRAETNFSEIIQVYIDEDLVKAPLEVTT